MINPEFEQYLKDPGGDTELKALFDEIEICSQQYDEKSAEVKQLCQEVQNLALSIDLECSKLLLDLGLDDGSRGAGV